MDVRALPSNRTPARGRLLVLLAAALLLTGLLVPGLPRLGASAAAAAECPCSIWPGSATPAVANDPESSAIEVGVKFRASQSGSITGIRFYKGAQNTGTHSQPGAGSSSQTLTAPDGHSRAATAAVAASSTWTKLEMSASAVSFPARA